MNISFEGNNREQYIALKHIEPLWGEGLDKIKHLFSNKAVITGDKFIFPEKNAIGFYELVFGLNCFISFHFYANRLGTLVLNLITGTMIEVSPITLQDSYFKVQELLKKKYGKPAILNNRNKMGELTSTLTQWFSNKTVTALMYGSFDARVPTLVGLVILHRSKEFDPIAQHLEG